MMALAKRLAERFDKWRREWLDQMNHVVSSDGGLPPDIESIVRVRGMAEQFSDETGDAGDIDRLLASHLQRIETDASGWRTTYRDTQTGQLWELTYPRVSCTEAAHDRSEKSNKPHDSSWLRLAEIRSGSEWSRCQRRTLTVKGRSTACSFGPGLHRVSIRAP